MTLFLKATYNPEDNKLRLYFTDERLPDDIYQKIVKSGFIYAPVQQLLVATWSPEREDICNEYVDSIVPDDITLADRAIAKVDRLEAIAKNVYQMLLAILLRLNVFLIVLSLVNLFWLIIIQSVERERIKHV